MPVFQLASAVQIASLPVLLAETISGHPMQASKGKTAQLA